GAIGLCILLRTIGTPGLGTELPIATVVAAFLVATAIILFRMSDSDQIVGCKVVGGLLLTRAAVALVLPFLALAPATVDLARLLVSAFAVAIAIGLIVLVLRRQQAVAEGTARALQSEIETRRRAEVEALQAQRRFEDFVETALDWVWERDADLKLTYVSQQIVKLTGRGPESYVGRSLDEVFEFYVTPDGREPYRRVLEARQPFRDFRVRVVDRRTGRLLTLSLSGKPLFDAAGNFTGYRGNGRDITESVETRSVLEAIVAGVERAIGQDYFQALVEHLALALEFDCALVGTLDAETGAKIETVAMYLDGKLIDNVEYALDGTPCATAFTSRMCVYPSNVAALFPTDHMLQGMGAAGYAGTPLIGAAGRAIGLIALVKRAPIANVEVVKTVLTVLATRAAAEIERKIADAALRAAEQRFRAVIDNMPIALHLKDKEGRFITVNKAFTRWTGIEAEALKGRTHAVFAQHMEWANVQVADAVTAERMVQETGEVYTRERMRAFRDGQQHDLVVSTFPICDDAGRIVGTGTTATDVTEHRQMERSLAQVQKMDAVGRLAGGIAHDFNGLLGTIVGFASFIVEDTPRDSNTHGFADRILRASSRAKQLVQQILTFSRRSEAERKRIELADVVGETLELFRATIPETTRLEFNNMLPDAAVDADASQIGQVLMNICVNANDALAGGTGHIRVRIGRLGDQQRDDLPTEGIGIEERPDGTTVYVVGTLKAASDYVVIGVTDTGPGMTRAVIEKIFEPFFTTKPKGHGTGLGLSVVHGIVLGHDGVIVVSAKRNVGTSFEILLPLSAAARAEAREIDHEEPPPHGKGRVLVVDDNVEFGDMLSIGLERLGYEVAASNDAVEALEAFASDPEVWDLVLTDQTMPRCTGLELIQRVKAIRPNLPCVLCTGYSSKVSHMAAVAAGASALIANPLDIRALARLVADLTQRPQSATAALRDRTPG
ncbi:MAG: PAS domain S-box protein, partial [Proteobacteria bacterium]|nr:PAS domain S-box protein [Pseudomonadota bacterium]